jgi:hypothetical protein
VLTPLFFVCQLLMLATLIGLAVRGRWRLSAFFPSYLVWSLIAGLRVAVEHERFGTHPFHTALFGVADLLKLGIAIEIGWRTFRHFPGAAVIARRVALAIVAVTAMATAASMAGAQMDPDVAASTILLPRLESGTLWLMAATLLVGLWYRVPIHPFHSVLLTSLAAYMALRVVLTTLTGIGAGELGAYLGTFEDAGFALAACWWAYAAWHRQSETSTFHVVTLRKVRVEFMTRDS